MTVSFDKGGERVLREASGIGHSLVELGWGNRRGLVV